VSFKNTVIIMTSNLGSSEIFDQLDRAASPALNAPGSGAMVTTRHAHANGHIGTNGHTKDGNMNDIDYESDSGEAGRARHEARRLAVKEKVMEHVRKHFRPEFINRIDDYITFEPLQPAQIKKIVVLRAQVGD
jgi:ATP-dependent Clp protease ATP-binding subunit ClpB